MECSEGALGRGAWCRAESELRSAEGLRHISCVVKKNDHRAIFYEFRDMMDFCFYGLKIIFGSPEGTLWLFSSKIYNYFCGLGSQFYTEPLKPAHMCLFTTQTCIHTCTHTFPCIHTCTHTCAQTHGWGGGP